MLAASVQGLHRLSKTIRRVVVPLFALHGDGRIRFGRGQIGGRRVRAFLFVRIRHWIERQIARAQALLHVGHFARRNTQFVGDRLSFARGQPAQVLLGLAQIEEQLALRFRGGDLHQSPVAKDIFVNLRANPMDREGDQTYAHGRIEAFDGLHQADVTFLNQVAHWQAVAAVAARDMNDEPQVRQHQLACRIQVPLFAESRGQIQFFFPAEHRDSRHALHVRIQAAYRAGEDQIRVRANNRCSCGHVEDVLQMLERSLAITMLEC